MSTVNNQATAAVETFAFRAIVRGTLPSGVRVRRVRNVQCASDDITPALLACETISSDIAKGEKMVNVFTNVYPPVGFLLKGGLSKGWAVAVDGSIERVKA